ncbi:MAG: thioesterase family protein [Acidimicrobiia bacterium]|jgi:hypothetical protein
MEPSSYFTVSGDGTFHPTDYTRGPWSIDACHAGPPTGLIARASEALVSDKPLVRLLVEIIRPIPMSGFRIGTVIARTGRTVTTTRVELHDDERSYARAEGLHLAEGEIGAVASHHIDLPDPAESIPGPFPIASTHGEVAFGDSLEVRYVPGLSQGAGGETFMWARCRVPLLDGEEPSPFQAICPLADSGNGISFHEGTETMAFVNADLVLALHRPPNGDWFGSHTVSFWEPNGIGRADAELFDATGPVGRAVQNLVLRRHS